MSQLRWSLACPRSGTGQPNPGTSMESLIAAQRWLYGGIAGAVIYKMLQDGIATLTPQYWQFWIGLFLVVFVMVGRQRLMGGLYGLLAMARRR